ncbi:MAG: ATPase domain-containing protein [Polyangia bacterium]
MNELQRVSAVESTGDRALDLILGGGIPAHSVNVIAGDPGSGKTILTLQILFELARRGKRCLYFTTLSEPALKLVHHMQQFSFFDAGLLDNAIRFVDISAAVSEGSDRAVETIIRRAEDFAPDVVVIDSFRAIGEAATASRRPLVYDLGVQLAAFQAITFLVGEYRPDEYSMYAEFAIADGIIRLGSYQQELQSLRQLEVLKLRGAGYVRGCHFYDISARGLAVYPRVSAPEQVSIGAGLAIGGRRVSTGVAGLDDLLGGGLPAGSATLVQGGTGIGKTILCLQFLLAGARQDERGIFFALEETPEHLRAIAGALGFDLAEEERKGNITICYSSPVELSTDRFLFDARRLVEEVGAKRAVFDSLTSMSLGIPSQRRFKELTYSLCQHLRRAGTTVLMTMESEQTFGVTKLTGYGISFLADVLIQMRYVEWEGTLERAISVIKARGIKHSTEFRSVTIDQGGIAVMPSRFERLRGVLTGLPARDR